MNKGRIIINTLSFFALISWCVGKRTLRVFELDLGIQTLLTPFQIPIIDTIPIPSRKKAIFVKKFNGRGNTIVTC